MSIEKVYTTAEVAEMERCTAASISDACRAGDFPGAYRLSPTRGEWRIPESAIVEHRRLLAEREQIRREKQAHPSAGLQDPAALADTVGMPIGSIAPLMPRARRRRRLASN